MSSLHAAPPPHHHTHHHHGLAKSTRRHDKGNGAEHPIIIWCNGTEKNYPWPRPLPPPPPPTFPSPAPPYPPTPLPCTYRSSIGSANPCARPKQEPTRPRVNQTAPARAPRPHATLTCPVPSSSTFNLLRRPSTSPNPANAP